MDGDELKTFVSGRSGAHPNGTLAKGDGTTYTGCKSGLSCWLLVKTSSNKMLLPLPDGSLRRDGFASLVVSSEQAPAVITTRPLIWQEPTHLACLQASSRGVVLTGRKARRTCSSTVSAPARVPACSTV